MALSTSTDAGTGVGQNVQSPQDSTAISGTSAPLSTIQPGTATDLLRDSSGISLNNTPVTTVSLGTATASQSVAAAPKPHHLNAGLLIVSLILFTAAISLFWSTTRSVNNTTV